MKISRGKMLAALAAGGSSWLAQERAGIDPTLYIPKARLVEDCKLLHDFMDEYSFVDLVTSSPTLRVTHIPVILDRTAGATSKIFGHISRQNPQSQTFDGRHIGVIVFRLADLVCQDGRRADGELRRRSRHGPARSLKKSLCTICPPG